MEEYVDQTNDKAVGPDVARYWYGGQSLFCGALILLSAYVIFDSIRFSLPYLERGDATLFDMPGLGPILVALLLMLLSVALIIKCAGAGGKPGYFVSRDFLKALGGAEARIVYIVFGTLAIYVFLLFPYLPYALATMIFLVGLMAFLKLFTWRSFLISAIFSGALWLVFGYGFSINLPY